MSDENRNTDTRHGETSIMTAILQQDAPFRIGPSWDGLSLIETVSQELTSISHPEELLRRVADQVRNLIDFQHMCLYIWDEEEEVLNIALSIRYGELSADTHVLRLGQGVCGAAALSRKAQRIPDVRKDPRFLDCGARDVRSELAVPLLFKERLIGVINLESVHPDAFSRLHERILQTLASSIAVSLVNARLFQDLGRQEKSMATDLAMARRVQKALLPQHAPWIPGIEIGSAYRPARQLGGDFYDYLSCAPGRLTVAVGDVSGKSTAAALFGAMAIGMLRGQVVRNPCSPTELLRTLNSKLHSSHSEGRFLALVAANYDDQTSSLTLANAGLPHPLHYSSGAVRPILVEGMPLGLFPGVRYEESVVPLSQGDVVALHSDGVSEAMDASGCEYGTDPISLALSDTAQQPAQSIAEEILERSLEYSGGEHELEDDRTVLIIKRV